MNARGALLLLLALGVAAPADTLLLRDGTKVTGRWWSADAGQVHFLVDDQLKHYPRAEVSAVGFGDVTLPAPPPAAPPPPTPVAAAPRSFPQPREIGAVYALSGSGDLMALESRQATAHRRYSAQYWEIPSLRSSVRLKKAADLVFVVRLEGKTDPSAFSLYPLETSKSARLTQADSANHGNPLTVKFVVGRLGESTYTLTVKDLPAGEYAFSPAGSNTAYCFAVDGPAPGR